MSLCTIWLFISTSISTAAFRHTLHDVHNLNVVEVSQTAAAAAASASSSSSRSASSTGFDCDAQIASCKALYQETKQAEKCDLRGDACSKGKAYWSQFTILNEPCWNGTWNGWPAEVATALASTFSNGECNPDLRELTGAFVNIKDVDKADAAFQAFIYQEVTDTIARVGCALHASYRRIYPKYQMHSLTSRGLVDAVSFINQVSTLASFALPGIKGQVAAAANLMAMMLIRSLWFNEIGSELIGMRFKVLKDPRPHPMSGCSAPRLEAHELWEITAIERFGDASFPQYLPRAVHHVLVCIKGKCTDKRGNPAPPVLLNLQGAVETVAQNALIVAAKQLGVAYEESEGAFEAFLRAAR